MSGLPQQHQPSTFCHWATHSVAARGSRARRCGGTRQTLQGLRAAHVDCAVHAASVIKARRVLPFYSSRFFKKGRWYARHAPRAPLLVLVAATRVLWAVAAEAVRACKRR